MYKRTLYLTSYSNREGSVAEATGHIQQDRPVGRQDGIEARRGDGTAAAIQPPGTPRPAASSEPRRRAKRDPEGRRRAIVEAAVEIIVHEGTRKLTHRRVAQQAGVPLGSTTHYFSSIDELRRAGLSELGRLIESDYDEMFRAVDANGGDARAYARELNDYLADSKQVEVDTAFFTAAVNDPELRELARRSIGIAIRRSLPYVDERRAKALTMLMDGAMLETCLLGHPVDPDAIDLAVQAIFGTKPDPGNGAR